MAAIFSNVNFPVRFYFCIVLLIRLTLKNRFMAAVVGFFPSGEKKYGFNPGLFINIDLFRETCDKNNWGQTKNLFLRNGHIGPAFGP